MRISACTIFPSGPADRESSSAPSAFTYHAIACELLSSVSIGVTVWSPSGTARFAFAMIPPRSFQVHYESRRLRDAQPEAKAKSAARSQPFFGLRRGTRNAPRPFAGMANSLFSPLTLRGITLANRIVVSPMCEYSSADGFANDWHLVHLGIARRRAERGSCSPKQLRSSPEGRISPDDLGIWKDEHIAMLARITAFIREHGSVAGIQLAHAGEKRAPRRPWKGGKPIGIEHGGWSPDLAPSAIPFDQDIRRPLRWTRGHRQRHVGVRRRGAPCARCRVPGHRAARGARLSHPRVSLAAQQHTHRRIRRELRESHAIAARDHGGSARVWPETLPLFVRISATEWTDGGWDIEQSIELARMLAPLGVDLIDCSSGGNVPRVRFRWDQDTRCSSPSACEASRSRQRERWGSSRARSRRTRSCTLGAQTSCCSRAKSFAIRIFHSTPRSSSARTFEWPKQYLRAKD